MSSLAIVVCTLDEELHIERCIESVRGLGAVFIVDAGSRDRTRELARAAGATVVEHAWTGYSAQKNWALAHLPMNTDWVLMLDADEHLTEAGRSELAAAIASTSHAGFHLPRQNVFMGRVLKHAWWYPDYQLRLFRRDAGRYEDRLVHEHVLLEGTSRFLEQPLLHENLKNTDAFLERHARYAELEAREIEKWRRGDVGGQRRGRLLGTWPERRRALKTHVWYRLPARPQVRFLWMYLVKRGFLDGRAGLVYSRLLADYERQINRALRARPRATDAKDAQAAWFDEQVDPEYEITRPHGTPRLHRWLLEQKFKRSVEGLDLTGATVLSVCAGSGMDAEFLARAGAIVTAADISSRAVQRTEERAQRYGLSIEAVVADAESLPFDDDSFDIVYVHDGLHHLEDPERALREMARVARRAVSVSEPARAAVTNLAVWLGIAQHREEAGNVVARLAPERIVALLRECGFEPTTAARYGMYYQHQPGRPSRLLSTPGLFALTRGVFRALNSVGGRLGNKLVVVAVRR